MKIWRGYCKVLDKVSYACMVLGVACVLFMAALISTEIIGRTFFSWSTMIADEYGGYLLCAVTFFTGAYCLQKDTFLRVEIVYSHLQGRTRKIVDIIDWSLAIVLCSVMLRFVCRVWASSYSFGAVSTSYSHTPLIYPQGVMIVGFVLLLLQLVRKLVDTIITPAELFVEDAREVGE